MIRFQPPTISNKIVQIVNHLITHRQRFHHECNPILFLKNKKNKSPTQKKAKKTQNKKPTELPDIFSVATGAVSNFVAFSQPAAALGTVPTRCRCEARPPSG